MARAQIRVASGNYITARPIGVVKGIDFQFTGAVRKVDAVAISRRLDAGEVVLVPHLGYSPTGEVFNVAWEDVAESVAMLPNMSRSPMTRRARSATSPGRASRARAISEVEALRL